MKNNKQYTNLRDHSFSKNKRFCYHLSNSVLQKLQMDGPLTLYPNKSQGELLTSIPIIISSRDTLLHFAPPTGARLLCRQCRAAQLR